MNKWNDMVCSLCLKASQKRTLIDETARQMLDVLLVKTNFGDSTESCMCEDCAEIIKKSVYFVLNCLESEKSILMYATGEDVDFKCDSVDLRAVYAYISNESVDRDDAICRFCIRKLNERNFMPLDVLMTENTFSDMVKQYMFQMDLNIVKNPSICLHCQDDMERYFKFLWNCHDTGQKINSQNLEMRCGERVILNSVFETFFECTRQNENNLMTEIEETFNTEDVRLNALLYQNGETRESEEKINRQNLEIKGCGELNSMFETFFEDTRQNKSNLMTEIKEEFATEDKGVNALLHQNVETTDDILCVCNIRNSSCFRCLAKVTETTQEEKVKVEAVPCNENGRILKIEIEKLIIKDKIALNESTDQHRNINKTAICICKTRRKKCLKCNSKFEVVSTSLSRKVYKCNLCAYQGTNIKLHLLEHEDISEDKFFHCDSCKYKTKDKRSFRNHLLVHKDISEVQMYSCHKCDFKTKRRDYLKRHLLTHKDLSEVQTYQCDICEYQTRTRYNLKRHLSTHKDVSQVQIYQCDSCDYQVNHRGTFRKHLLTQKHFSDLRVYRCDSCKYRTYHKGNFKNHLLIHKDFSDLRVYRCDSCEYRAYHKGNFKMHLLIHKNFSDVQTFECNNCQYQTDRKVNLKRHLLLYHRNLSEVTVYRCDSCKFETKFKGNLRKHQLIHRNFSGVKVYPCDSCKFQTIYKESFNRHLLTHKHISEVQIYQCNNCEFQTRYKVALKVHLKRHFLKR